MFRRKQGQAGSIGGMEQEGIKEEMKIKTRICDICGESIYQHAAHTYTIRKRMWETETLGKRLDLCEKCWQKFERWVKREV